MPCPCICGAESRIEFLSCLVHSVPSMTLHRTRLSLLPSPPHTNTPTPAHVLLLLQADSYHHPTHVILSNVSPCVFKAQPGTIGYLSEQFISQSLLTCVSFRKYPPRHLFSRCFIPATLPSSFLHLPTSHQLLVSISKDSL